MTPLAWVLQADRGRKMLCGRGHSVCTCATLCFVRMRVILLRFLVAHFVLLAHMPHFVLHVKASLLAQLAWCVLGWLAHRPCRPPASAAATLLYLRTNAACRRCRPCPPTLPPPRVRRSDAVSNDEPFFIELAPTAPHDQGLGKVAVPNARHEHLYTDVTLPQVCEVASQTHVFTCKAHVPFVVRSAFLRTHRTLRHVACYYTCEYDSPGV
eukprot:354648-Chlamydomonas_euryale.AAC.1